MPWCLTYSSLAQLRHIPTLGGPSDPIFSFWSAINYIFNSTYILREGYERVRAYHAGRTWRPLTVNQSKTMLTGDQFKDSTFKVANLDSWTVILNGPLLVDDVRKRTEDELSVMESNEEVSLSRKPLMMRRGTLKHLLVPSDTPYLRARTLRGSLSHILDQE